MPRIKLEEQPVYEFTFPVTLYPRDINYGGHLGNDSVATLMGSARVHMLHSMGLGENDLGDGKTGFIMSDLIINFKAEAFIFDELMIDTHVGEMRSSGFRLFHRFRKNTTLVALAETGLVGFDHGIKKMSPIPEFFRKRIEEIQKSR